ncbi:hypothetical protein EHRUM1_02930 [Ehrlichia ruminantium]|nr:hypothetical protein EHRUM1_02930 [Ehrlichia ruminantium]
MIFLILAYTISFSLLLGLSTFIILGYSKSKKDLEGITHKDETKI